MSNKYGVPDKYVSCPSCGLVYGHHNTKVCTLCECCSVCCKRNEFHITKDGVAHHEQPVYVEADEFIRMILWEDKGCGS